MARMIPKLAGFEGIPHGEVETFKALEAGLSDEYTVYHHVAFLDKQKYVQRKPKTPASEFFSEGEVDFLLFHDERGMLVIEVKGGEILYEEGQWYSRNRHGKYPIKNPFVQSRTGIHYFRKNASKVCPNIKLTYGYSVCFPDCQIPVNIDLPQDADRKLMLDASDILNPSKIQQRINRIYEEWERMPQRLSDTEIQTLRQKVFEPSFSLVSSYTMMKEVLELSLLQLTQQQANLLLFLDNHNRALIEGSAGTGKTVLAIEKCKQLSAENKDVLFLCFNTLLAKTWKERIDDKHITVFTFHQLCETLCKKANIAYEVPEEKEKLKEFYMDETPELLALATEALDLRYDGIVVDEGQDFEGHWWIPVEELLKSEGSIFYIFCDPEQNIFNRNHDFPITTPPFPLAENCRNSAAISSFLQKNFQADAHPKRGMPEGTEPQIHLWGDENEQLDQVESVLKALLNEGAKLDEITLLTPKNIYNSPCRKILSKPKFKELAMYSIMSFKGMESNVILLCDIGTDWLTKRSDLLYTGISRAKFQLHLFCHRDFEISASKVK